MMVYQKTFFLLILLLIGFILEPIQASTHVLTDYNAYSNTTQGSNTISPFFSIFGAITEQDPDNGVDEDELYYDFRGLNGAAVPVGQIYFFLEDFQDGQFDVPGATMTASHVRTDNGRNGSNSSGSYADSIDEDDGSVDGAINSPRGGVRSPSRFDFNESILGALPTHVGIALAGDNASITINAYDSGGNLLETATASANVKTAFVGVITAQGISYVTITGGTESDHFQYGRLGAADSTAPNTASFIPSNVEFSISANTNLTVKFNENIQAVSGNIVIKKLSDDSVVETLDVTSGRVTFNSINMIIDPTNDFDLGSSYYVEIDNGAVEDLAGFDFTGISGNSTWVFTIDNTNPTVLTLSPTNGATAVKIYEDLILTFSENIQKGSGNIIVKKLTDDSIYEIIDVNSSSVTISTNVVTIQHTYWDRKTSYYVEMDSGVIKDMAELEYAGISGSSTWSFYAEVNIFLSKNTYHAYDNTAQGSDTISPFASIFGAITEQDPDGGVGEDDESLYDFRGLKDAASKGSTYFFLEDCHDGQFDVPGATMTASHVRTDNGRNGSTNAGSNADNVDEDDGNVDGSYGSPRGGMRFATRFDFNSSTLGLLPTYVGIVSAEGANTIVFKAYDSDNNLVADVSVKASFTDPFIGAYYKGGIAYITLSGGSEYDHFQYGRKYAKGTIIQFN